MAEQVHQYPDRAAELVRLVPAENAGTPAWRLGYLESVVQELSEEAWQMFGRLGESKMDCARIVLEPSRTTVQDRL